MMSKDRVHLQIEYRMRRVNAFEVGYHIYQFDDSNNLIYIGLVEGMENRTVFVRNGFTKKYTWFYPDEDDNLYPVAFLAYIDVKDKFKLELISDDDAYATSNYLDDEGL